MKFRFSQLFLITFACLWYLTIEVTPQVPKEGVEDIEYQVYSAYINQIYLAKFNNVWFTINGTESRTFEHLDRIEEVVIYSLVVPETTNGYSRFANVPYRAQLPNDLLEDFLKRNKDYYSLSDRFDLKVKHSLFSQEDAISLASEAAEKKADYGRLFLRRYPKAVGSVGFFRVGFNPSRSKAILGTAIGHFYSANWSSGYQIVLLSYDSGAWKVDKVFPEDASLKVNLEDCKPNSKHHYLPFGSAAFTVIGKEKDRCRVQEFNEEEGGYLRTDCLIPIGFKELLVSGVNPFIYSLDISKYCEKPKSGNVFFDQFDPGRKTERDL